LSDVESGANTIRRGHGGEEVRTLQRALNTAGIQPPLEEDGLFGPLTDAAVRQFQGRAGTATGLVDRDTLSALRPHTAAAPRPDDRFGRTRTRSPRAPHVDQRAPDRSVPAGRLRRDDEQRRVNDRTPPGLVTPGAPSSPGVEPPGRRGVDPPGRRGVEPPGSPVEAPGRRGVEPPGSRVEPPGRRGVEPPDRRGVEPPGRRGVEPPGSPNAPATQTTRYDGRRPAPGTTSRRASRYSNPPLTNSVQQGRNRNTYDQVINQFGVGTNPRYTPRNGNTYCNIFVWDVTRAMGAEIPHWVQRDGTPARPFDRGARELSANGTVRWLNRHGARYGWRRVTADEAQRNANRGRPTVVVMPRPGGTGHVAIVRPGVNGPRGPAMAQAGARNFNNGNVRDVFRRTQPQYWIHD